MAKDGNRQKFAGVAGGNLTPQQQGGDEGTDGAADVGGTDGAEPDDGQQGAGEDPDDKGGKPKPKGKTYTDADVDEIVKKRISRERAQIEKQIREQIKREADDQRSEAEKLAGMNDLQRAQYALDKANAEKAELERRINLSEQMGVARAELKAAGIDLGDELLSMFVTEKADDTNAADLEDQGAFPQGGRRRRAGSAQAPAAEDWQRGQAPVLRRELRSRIQQPNERRKEKMALSKAFTYGESESILDSEVGIVAKTRTATQAMAKEVDGRKIDQGRCAVHRHRRDRRVP